MSHLRWLIWKGGGPIHSVARAVPLAVAAMALRMRYAQQENDSMSTFVARAERSQSASPHAQAAEDEASPCISQCVEQNAVVWPTMQLQLSRLHLV